MKVSLSIVLPPMEEDAAATAAAAISAATAAAIAAEDDEHDAKETVLLRYFLLEWDLVKALLDRIVSNNGASDPSDVNKIRSIMDKYQEQGQLLEPYLESIVSPLMHIVRTKASQLSTTPDEALEIIKPLSIIIYSLVTVCGYKSVIRFFPHQVSDLELAVALLEKCHNAASGTSLRQESTGEMETKCLVLLWLCILVLIPFDISSVDTSIADGSYKGGMEPSPLVMRILDISKDYLSSAGPMRRISGMLLARLLTRPDMPKAFNSFAEWAHEVLLSVSDDFVDHFRLLGIVEALASLFKVGNRKFLLNVVSSTWSDSSVVMKSSTAARSSLLRKFLVKLSQRIGLTCLPHRSPAWRYLGRSFSLAENMLPGVIGKTEEANDAQYRNDIPNSGCLEEEDADIPEIVEDIIEVLLSGLRDSDTIVRWSAAKGIGRVTARLTSTLSEDVLSSVLELFLPGEGDSSWHGGCLALAELARRGLLLPVSFPQVVPVIVKALHYDIRKGPHSIGSHVRDAAAYVCWAFGRAYSTSDMKEILEHLAPHLLTVACYDREVNCRRAASAAFQENVGRQGTFPHGIEIVNTSDYFSLASRVNSYLNVAVCIAQYKEYLYSFVEELLSHKIPHWDRSLRELAAGALAALAKYDLDFFAGYVLEKLIPCTVSLDLCMRHGATFAAGELVVALHRCGFTFSMDKQKALSNIVPAIEKARLYRGKGGEVMRSAVSRYIQCISLAGVSLNEKIKRSLLDTLNENLKHPNAQIQCAAVDALKQFFRAYLVSSVDKVAKEVNSKYLGLLDDPNVAARRGAPLALGILPYEFLVERWKVIITKLCSCCTIQHMPDDPDAEARVNAIRGLVLVCETLTEASSSTFGVSVFSLIKAEVIDSLFKALDDYSVDNRGDVGSWVREAAMDGLERCTYILCKGDCIISEKASASEHLIELSDNLIKGTSYPSFDAKIATNLVGCIAKQAVEKIDRIREIAAKTLQRILHNKKCFVPFIPHRDILEVIIPSSADLKWAVPTLSYPRLVQLLGLSCYSRSVLSGLVISVGGLQESLRKVTVSALLEYIQVAEADTNEKRVTREYILSTDFLWILEQYHKCDRVIAPTLKTVEILLSKKVFFNMEGCTAEADTPTNGPCQQYAGILIRMMAQGQCCTNVGHTHNFLSRVLDSLAVELKGSKDFPKLCSGLSILGYIASLVGPISFRALSQLLTFLAHRYPKIRKAAADQIYLVLLQNVNIVTEEKMEKAFEVLAETCWEGNLEEAKLGRLQLYEMTGVEAEPSLKLRDDAPTSGRTPTPQTDENVSYSSLVGFSGF